MAEHDDSAYLKEDSFSFQGTPDDIEVEVELNDTTNSMTSYDPFRLSEVLLDIGEKMTGIHLYDYQKPMCFRIIYSIMAKDGAEITGLFSRQSGKSEIVVFTSVTLAVLLPVLAKIFPNELGYYKNGIKMGLFAPQGEQVETVYRRCMTRLLSEPVRIFLNDPDILDGNVSQVHFKLKSGSTLTGQSAAKQAKIESKSYSLVYIDESQEVDSEKVRKSIIPMTAACVCAGTNVYNAKGERVVIEKFIDEEERIIGYDGQGSFIDTVNWKQNKTGTKECYRITTNSGRTLECSFDHPILSKPRDTRKLEYIPTYKLPINTQIAIIDKVNLFGDKRMFNPRLIGMLIGDGNYTKDTTVSFSNADKELWDYILKTQKVTFSKYNHTTKDGRWYREGTIPGLCGKLRQLGIYGQVSRSKRLPKDIDKYSKKVVTELIGGLFDTDGTVQVRDGRRGSISITFAGLPLIEDIFYLLDKLGIHGRIDYCKPNTNGYAGANSKGFWKYTINEKISVERFCKEIKLLVPHKQEKLNQLLEVFSKRKAKRQKNIDGLYFERVVSVESIGEQTIYNLSAETHHNYVANGIVTHNTFGTIVRTGTPARKKGDFYETIQNNKREDKKLRTEKERLKKQLHFQYNYQEVIASKKRQFHKDQQDFHLLYEKAVMRDKKSQGENSDSFRMSYRIEWLLEIGMFITEDALEEKCFAKRLGLPQLAEQDFVVAGLDIASARNNTVLTTGILDAPADDFGERPKKTLLDWLVVGNTNYEELFHIVAQELIDKRVRVLFADYTGVGRALTDVLMHHLGDYIEIVPYTFSPASKSDMWKALDEDIINGNIIIPAHKSVRSRPEFQLFQDEITHLSKTWKGSFMVCEKTPGWNDDTCDSLGLMNLAGNYLYVPQTEMEITENTIINTKERYNLKNQSRW